MNEIIEKKEIKVENMIYEIRGKQVMLDRDLAKLYKTNTKRINEAVRRNIEKFPERFSWQLSNEEYQNLKSKVSTSSLSSYGGRRTLPRVFTEQGVAMLATILKSKIAVQVSISIMDAFVEMRKYIANNNYDKRLSNIEIKLIEHDNSFKELFDKFETKPLNHLFYEGQIYDAYSLMLDILNISKESIIIIDNYVDKKLLDILSKTNKNILIITNKYNNDDYLKYKEQYNNVKIKISNSFHDRFIIIDNKYLYHSGASFKDLGKKCFGISKIEDNKILTNLLNSL